MELPQCPNYLAGRCPQSDVVLMAEHGPAQATWYTSFRCRTDNYLFFEWNPAVVEKAKRGELDREIGNLINPRFRGIVE